jgi:hypothetical protein
MRYLTSHFGLECNTPLQNIVNLFWEKMAFKGETMVKGNHTQRGEGGRGDGVLRLNCTTPYCNYTYGLVWF